MSQGKNEEKLFLSHIVGQRFEKWRVFSTVLNEAQTESLEV